MNKIELYKNIKLPFLLIMGMFIGFHSIAQPVADFDVLVKKGCSPLEVTFINNSSPATGLSYQWILGNGNTSALSEPYAIYINSGSYTVTLIVSDGISSDTLVKSNFITVFQNPVADFEVIGQHTGCVPLSLTLSNLALQGDTAINTWSWDFGDGHISNDSLPSQIYLFPGTFNLSLMVVDKNGCAGSMILDNYVEVYKTVSSFSADKSESCTGTLLTAFTNLSQGSDSITYIWNFGDGNTSAETDPVYNYTSSGIFDVSLIATDNHGCSDTLMKTNYISIIEVSASFSVPNDTACRNNIIYFTNTSANATAYIWNFGDSTFSSQFNPTHAYNYYGSFNVQLIVSRNGFCADTSTYLMRIDYVIADFSISQNFSCQLPVNIQYTNNSENAVAWEWHFGNGDSSALQDPVNSIVMLPLNVNQFSFVDTLIAISPFGCRDMKIHNPSIVVNIPKAYFIPNNSISDLHGCVPLTFNFLNKSSYLSLSDSIVAWEWTFSDAPISLNWNVSKTYMQAGAFKVSLSITTALGCTDSFSDSVFTGTLQNPFFTLNAPDSICASQNVEIVNLSQDTELIDQYFWLFSDGTVLTAPNPVVFFNDTGYITGSLTVVYHGCESTFTKDSLIYIKGPYVSFQSNYSCDKPLEYTFTGNILGAENYFWSFGDQTPDIADIPLVIHNFIESGDYHISLYAENNTYGCAFLTAAYIFPRELSADFSMSDSVACAGTEFSFDATASHDVDEFFFNNLWVQYLWYFNDNNEYKYPDTVVTHKFNSSGNYSVSLIVADQNGCKDTLTKKVNLYRPNVNFTSDYQFGCIPVTFAFINQTVSDTTVTDWLWSFGDSTFSTSQNPLHEYQNFGVYNVSLWAEDTLGCDTILSLPGFIHVQNPEPTFLADDKTLCVGVPAHFYDNSQSEIVSYFWNFGDGDTSVAASPNHAYLDSGHYTVSLRIIDNHGCDSTGTVLNFIHVQQPPQANFICDIFSATCYPAHISFTDSSVSDYLAYWHWSFGDNNVASEMQNPIHTYWKPGVYDISLIAATSYGCADTIIKENYVTIGGPWAEILHPDTVCIFNTVTLVAINKINVYALKWDLGNGNFSLNDTASMSYSVYGNVYPSMMLYLDSMHTCDVGITDTINVYRVIADFTVNNNDYDGCVPLDISCSDLSENAKHYSWFADNILVSSTSQLQQSIQTSGIHTIQLIVSNDFICYDTVRKNVIVFPLPVVGISSDTLMCRGTGTQLNASGGIIYTWFPQAGLSNASISNPVANPDSSIEYTVTVQDINNCIKDTSVFITVFQKPVIEFLDTIVVVGEHVQLVASNSEIMNYQWTPATGLSCTDCPDPVATPLEPTVYTVAVTDTNNCFTLEYQIAIDIMKKYSVDVPDMFTPNGDALNDVVYVRGWGIKELLEFRIFNRFGEQVFVSDNLDFGWDGVYKGENQNTETFTYIVSVRSYNDEIISKKGFIKLIR